MVDRSVSLDERKKSFILNAKEVHGEKYTYDNLVYRNMRTQISVFCNKCSVTFQILPFKHLSGQGCYTCELNDELMLRQDKTNKFIEKAKAVHGENGFDYSNTAYISLRGKISYRCKSCDHVTTTYANNHLNGFGCEKCKEENLKQEKKNKTENFKIRAKAVHGDKYNYDAVEYDKSYCKVKIYCNDCQTNFYQVMSSHLLGSGCSGCSNNKFRAKSA